MSVKVGDIAPDFSGTDLVKNTPWSLYGQGKADILLGFTQASVNSAVEGPSLQAMWQKLDGNTTKPFKMAVVYGAPPDDAAAVKALATKYKFTFPALFLPQTVAQYILPDQSLSAWYCLHWKESEQKYRADQVIIGSSPTIEGFESLLLLLLVNCGVSLKDGSMPMPSSGGETTGPFAGTTRPIVALPNTPMPVFMFFWGSPTTDGGGGGVTFAGRPVPIPPLPFQVLGAAGQDVMTGLQIAALSTQLSDSGAAAKAKRAGLEAAKGALSKL